jgi:hypothetical protein
MFRNPVAAWANFAAASPLLFNQQRKERTYKARLQNLFEASKKRLKGGSGLEFTPKAR